MALRTVYDRITPSEMARYTAENPWWGLGYLLAQNYNKNYDQRGIQKATEAGSEALEKAKANIDGTDYSSANSALDKVSERYLNVGNSMQGYEQAQGMPQGTGQNINKMLQQQPAEYEKMQGITPQRQPVVPDLSFHADDFRAKYIKEQQALGRPDYQIQQALATMEPQIKNLDDQARQLRTDETIKQLAGLAPDLNNPERLKLINALLKDNPELGKVFLADSITNRDKWTAQREDEKADKAMERTVKLKGLFGGSTSGSAGGTRGYAGGARSYSSSGGKGSAKSLLDTPEYKLLGERVEALKEKAAEQNGKLFGRDRELYNSYMFRMEQMESDAFNNLGYGDDYNYSVEGEPQGVFQNKEQVQQPNNTSMIDATNWNSVIGLVDNLRSNGKDNDEILNVLYSYVKNGKMPPAFYDEIKSVFERQHQEELNNTLQWSAGNDTIVSQNRANAHDWSKPFVDENGVIWDAKKALWGK